jgi:signal transduction histidine kinase/CheY-like chemotaxis protein
MPEESQPLTSLQDVIADLVRRNEKLAKINAALMQRVERSTDQAANAYSMFQTAIGLEAQVRVRTDELNNALNRLERVNNQLITARDGAELANRFKTRFFTAVGHDLLQPLHAARLSLSALSESSQAPQQQRLIAQVDHALSTIEELLGTILDLSKLEAGAVRPSVQVLQLADLFRGVAVDLEPISRSKNIALKMRPTSALVMSDALMLKRILQNLLANSVQYTEQGGVLLAARRRGDTIRIEVWDTGPGIAASEQKKIFEEFHRGAAAERSHAGGFGIGLAIILRMADALGHKIDLCSRPGRGTRFSIVVPRAEDGRLVAPLSQEKSKAALQAYGLTGIRAMVVDNDPSVLEGMRSLLGRWGCEARFAADARSVEELLAAEPSFRPDVVLADYHLANGDSGLRVVEFIRATHGKDIAAIIITADRSSDTADKAMKVGCEVLRKPIKPAELRALVLHLLA